MKRLLYAVAACAVVGATLAAQSNQAGLTSAEPFKLGTFEIEGQQAVGLVLRDTIVVDLEAANRALERSPAVVSVPMPADMRGLIARYEYGMSRRLYEIVNALVASNQLTGASRPAYVRDLSSVRTLAPILYPTKILDSAT